MVIYGEYLFLENFITGIIITKFTEKTAGWKTSGIRIFACGVCCGIYAFMLFTDVTAFLSLIGKLGFAVLVSRIAFGRRRPKMIIRGAVLFLLITFYGGIAIAILSGMGWQGITASAGVYMPAETYVTVSFAGSASVLLMQMGINLLRDRRRQQRRRTSVELSVAERMWNAEGLIDSGNLLREPLSGKPVAVVGRALFDEILRETGRQDARFAMIPYRSIGVSKGVLEGYRIDKLTAEGITVKRPVIAVWEDGKFLEEEESARQVLLPADMIEGGIYAEAE